jgi:hypothetical protein
VNFNDDTWDATKIITPSANTKEIDPTNIPVTGVPLGVTRFTVRNPDNSISSVNQNSSGVSYSWSVVSASGYTGFANFTAARADITILNGTELNPSIRVTTPARWPDSARLELQLAITYRGVTNTTARFVVTLKNDYWNSQKAITLSPNAKIINPKDVLVVPPGNGAVLSGDFAFSFSVTNSTITNSTAGLTYLWSVVGASGYLSGTGNFANEAAARADITFNGTSGTSLNPRINVGNSGRWPAGSTVTLQLAITYLGVTNSTARFVVTFNDFVATNMSQQITFIPDSKQVLFGGGSMIPTDITGFSATGSTLNHTFPGLRYNWEVGDIAGWQGVGDIYASVNILAGFSSLSPFLSFITANSQDFTYWADNAAITLRCIITIPTATGDVNRTATFVYTNQR